MDCFQRCLVSKWLLKLLITEYMITILQGTFDILEFSKMKHQLYYAFDNSKGEYSLILILPLILMPIIKAIFYSTSTYHNVLHISKASVSTIMMIRNIFEKNVYFMNSINLKFTKGCLKCIFCTWDFLRLAGDSPALTKAILKLNAWNCVVCIRAYLSLAA